jgi:hypothetical protein
VAVAEAKKGGIGTMQEVEPGGVPTIEEVNYKINKDENGRKRSKTDLRYRKTKAVSSGYFYI